MRRTTFIAQAGVIAAVYAAVTLLVLQSPAQLGWGPVQLRVSEALTVLALVTPAAVPGLALGSVVANSFMLTQVGPIALLDVIFGSGATLIGAIWSWHFRDRTPLALLGPVIANALIVPAYLPMMLAGLGFYTVPFLGLDAEGSWAAMYLFGVVTVGIGEAVIVYALGWPLLAAMRRSGLDRTIGNGE